MLADPLTTPEAARILGVSRQRVHQLVKAGILAGRRIGRDWHVERASVLARSRVERTSGPKPKGA
jgi:excisionase family DNA binding protein